MSLFDRAAHRRGVWLMVGATLCWASAGILVRNMSLRDTWEMTFWRSLFMLMVIFAFLVRQYRGAVLRQIMAVGLPGLIAGSLWAVMYICFIAALGRTTVANVLVLSSIAPFLAALFGRVFLAEQVPLRAWLAMAAAFAGITVMFVDSLGSAAAAGNLIALAIPFAFAGNVVILRRMHAHVDMIPIVMISGLISCAVTLPFALPLEADGKDLGLLAIMGAVQLGLGCVLMTLAAPHLAAAEIGLLAVLETVFGTLSTWLIIGERPSSMTLLGGGIVVVALVINELIALRTRRMSGSEEQGTAAQAGH